MKISGRSFYLRSLLKKDLNEVYLSWLRDPEVNQFLEINFSPLNKKQAEARLAKYNNKTNFFLGIFDKKKDKFIGTCTLKIDFFNKIAYLGYLIGDKNYWGTKAGVDSVALLMDFGFENHKLYKIWGISIVNNIGAIFNIKKLGFIQEGRLRGHARRKGKRVDRIIFGILKKEWLERRKNFYY